jgi:hypothetical protein
MSGSVVASGLRVDREAEEAPTRIATRASAPSDGNFRYTMG